MRAPSAMTTHHVRIGWELITDASANAWGTTPGLRQLDAALEACTRRAIPELQHTCYVSYVALIQDFSQIPPAFPIVTISVRRNKNRNAATVKSRNFDS